MCHADVHKQENIIKLVCTDEAYKEYIILIVFSRKEDFARRALVYLADAFSSQFDLDEDTQISPSSNTPSYCGFPTLLRTSKQEFI